MAILKELSSKEFKNKIVVVTGGANGMGRETALGFSRVNAQVYILDIQDEVGRKMESEIPNLTFIHCNLRSVSEIQNAFSLITKKAGKEVDILINFAGLANRTPVCEITEEEWDLLNDVNLKASFFCAQEAAKSMKKSSGGRIINIASVRAHLSDGRHTIYDVTKGGVQAMTRSLAVNLAPFHIHVNTVAPGYVLTPMTKHNLEDNANWLEQQCAKVPLRRLMECDEVVATVMFLCSDAASAITGQNLYVDGGQTIQE